MMAGSMTERESIERVIRDYFVGLHHADLTLLDSIFCDSASLQAPNIRRSKKEWLKLVASRPVPAELNHDFAYRLLSMELVGDQAMVKVHCPLLGHDYVDFLSLLKEQEDWKIVNKLYAENPSAVRADEED